MSVGRGPPRGGCPRSPPVLVCHSPSWRRGRCADEEYKNGRFRAAIKVLGLAIVYIWAGTLQKNGHIESFHDTPRRCYARPCGFESFQDAEAHLVLAIEDYNDNRARSSIGWLPPCEFFRLRERNNREW